MWDDSDGTRGQAYTLEAIIAALLIVSSLTFALQVTAVTPLSASTSNQHIENQQRASANGVLTAAQESGALKEAVLYWNDTAQRFYNTSLFNYYTNEHPDNEFGRILDRAFVGRGLAVNVELHTPGQSSPQPMVYRGEPSDNAVTASRMITLYDEDTLTAPGHENTNLSSASSYGRAVPERTNSDVYNVVRVEVTVWRM
ncbi:hypothetical protein HWV23_05110 [Natronomonas halophila]|uniref:DUF7288 family protein n=1 Tax=Natronomonas halophila TaxID=2747817 RepID=UPI0015B5951E|nr:hypothetical protein [Natronomonas halophila]QLD85125.1 hypothetical protein HWV23_05110 [Natronomonas halophila]